MYSIISHLFRNCATKSIKLISTENGRIKLQTLDDVKIYAHTQGIFFFQYKSKRQETSYYLQLAELMRGENRHRWAARCYIKALENAWQIYHNVAVSGEGDKGNEQECIDPYDIYKTARLHLLEIDNIGGLKKLKEAHQKGRAYADLELRYTINSRDNMRKTKVESLLDKDFFVRGDYQFDE